MDQLAYSLERIFPTELEKAWEAWIESSALEQWYSPVELSVVKGSVTSEAKPNGIWAVAVDASKYGFVAYFFGRYSKVEHLRKLTHTMNYTQSEAEFQVRQETEDAHIIEVDFEETSTGVLIRFSQYGQMPKEEALQAKAGMESYFDNLERFLAS